MNVRSVSKTAAIISLVLFFAYGCEKDSTTEISTSDREKFLGAWQGRSTGSNGTRNFNMNFTASNSSPSQILMSNFDAEGTGTFVPANIEGNNMSIPFTIVNGDTIQGSGVYNSNGTLSFTFTVRDGQTVDNRTGSANR